MVTESESIHVPLTELVRGGDVNRTVAWECQAALALGFRLWTSSADPPGKN